MERPTTPETSAPASGAGQGAAELPDGAAAPEMPAPPPEAPLISAAQTLPAWFWLLLRWLLVALALYGIGWLLVQARPALTPFILGLVMAYLLLPIVNRLNRRMPRWAAILIVYALGAVLAASAVAFIIPPLLDQTRQLISSIPSIEELEAIYQNALQIYRANVPPELREPIDNAALSALRSIQANLTSYAQGVGSFLFNRLLQIVNTVTFLVGLLIIPIWLFFVLNDQAKAGAAIDRMLHPRIRADFWNVWSIVNAVLSNYVRGQLILGLAIGVAVGLGLLALSLFGLGIPYALLLAILAGITELIPIIGPIIGAIPAVLIGLAISPTTAIAVLILYVVIQQLENNFLVPRIVGESIGIHPAILTVVLLAMGQVFGLIGVILSAPTAAIARDLFVYLYQRLSGASPLAARATVGEYARGEPHA